MTEKPKSKPKIRRKRRKKTKNYYFTKKHERAILEYSRTTDLARRSELYIELIGPALNELVDKIVYTYKFTTLPNIDYLRDDCKVWLITILDKYDDSRGTAAFSYFSVVTKNWFIQEVKKTSKKRKREVNYETAFKDTDDHKMVVRNEYETTREKNEFWINFFKEMSTWDTENLKENEKKVFDAVKILFESADDIEIFNKKAIYLYLRELTGLNTKQVVNNLNKLREKYRIFKKKWHEGKI